jgi:NAD-dependent deacetylase sirtuin 2
MVVHLLHPVEVLVQPVTAHIEEALQLLLLNVKFVFMLNSKREYFKRNESACKIHTTVSLTNMSAEDKDKEVEQLTKEVAKLAIDEHKTADVGSIIDDIKSVADHPKDKDILLSIADKVRNGDIKNIIVMTGAGISVSAGIPDFRTPGTGLYDNLQKYNLPYPEAVFDIQFFPSNPKPFFTLAKELWPGNFNPTPAHFFIKLLADKGLLLRNFTQNIDGLERVASVDADLLVEAHGTFATATCLDCGSNKYDQEFVKTAVFAGEIPKCTKRLCKGIVKPDIVFFGESLPERFHTRLADFKKCDLLIVMGTSLMVQPFASLTGKVTSTVPRILVNREPAGGGDDMSIIFGNTGTRMRYQTSSNSRDVFVQSDCDVGVRHLAKLFGMEEDLDKLIQAHKDKAKL